MFLPIFPFHSLSLGGLPGWGRGGKSEGGRLASVMDLGRVGVGGEGLRSRTARMRISMGLLDGLRFRNEEMVLDQEDVSSVVVLI